MTHSPAEPRRFTGRWFDALVARGLGPAALGCGVTASLLLLYVSWEAAFGHLRFLAEHSLLAPDESGPRIALTVIVLIGFIVGTRAYEGRKLAVDIEDIAPLLRGSTKEHVALARQGADALRRAGWIGSLVAIPIGLAVVTSRPGVPFLVSDEPWNHDLIWALACNVLLFSILGRTVMETFRENQFFGRIESRLEPVDLLEPQRLAPFARRGLRTAFRWIGGSSIASIIFVNQGFSWPTGLVLLGTLSLGTLAFLGPVQGLRGKIRDAKERELERVRAAIRRARDELLGPAAASRDATPMAGLLAYEQRISSVREWPLDPPQIVRFALMIAIGLGSWMGGAVVGHLVEALWR